MSNTITINDADILSDLISGPADEFLHIEHEILSNDPEDGGATHYLVIKNEADDKFYSAEFTDWDYDWEYCEDFEGITFTEVFPKTVKKVIYER